MSKFPSLYQTEKRSCNNWNVFQDPDDSYLAHPIKEENYTVLIPE